MLSVIILTEQSIIVLSVILTEQSIIVLSVIVLIGTKLERRYALFP